MTTLTVNYPGDANVHLQAAEHGERIVFLHSVREGPASQSYGLQVAALAGVPAPVLKRARQQLAQLEAGSSKAPQLSLFTAAPDPEPAESSALTERLAAVDPDALTPREAHSLIYDLQSLLADSDKSPTDVG